jgi:signal transduction histidine kinase/DNA-binding response OmpR family regulator/ligand-binding sensor domain-containing protein
MYPALIFYRRLAFLSILLSLALISLSEVSVYGQRAVVLQSESINSKQGLPQAFVPAIVQDQQGFIWMATRDGLCRYDGNHFKVFQPTTDGKPSISSLSLSGLSLDKRGRIWVFSEYNDIDIIDPATEKFINISRQPAFKQQFGRDIVHAHYFDRQGRLWINFISNKVASIDPDTYRLRQYTHQATPGSFSEFGAFVQDQQGTIWLSNKTGLYRLDQKTARFNQYILPDNDVRAIDLRPNGDLFMLLSNSVIMLSPQSGRIRSFPLPANTDLSGHWNQSCIVADAQGNVYFNQYNTLCRFNQAKGISVLATLSGESAFRSLFIDRSDVLWAGTNNAGILKYNLKPSMFKAAPYERNFYDDLFKRELGLPANQVPAGAKKASPYIFRHTFDKSGKLWFNMGDKHIYQLDLNTKEITPIPFPVSLLAQHSWTYPIAPMATDPTGHVWVVTDSLAIWYEDGEWRRFQHPIRAKNRLDEFKSNATLPTGLDGQVLHFVVDKQALWLATRTEGLYRIDRITGQIRSYKNQPKNPASLSSNQLFCVFDDPLDQTILWVGTFGNGLCRFDKRTGTCRRFSTKTGLPNNVIYSAIPDKQGFLWIGTNQGLCRMDRRSFQTRTYTHDDGLLEDEFNHFHFLHLPDDRILLGGLGGITSFYPSQLQDDTYQPRTQITDIQLNNQSILPGPLTDSLPVQAISRLDLPYNQNFISIDFAALQYNRQGKIQYRHQLVGLDKTWIETHEPVVQYTDLRWGRYILKLNASNTSGIWSKYIRELTLVIRPPWWATWWAILLYIAGIVGLGYILVRAYLHQQEAKQLKAVDAMKAHFFTNIAHEFRTPLSLILGPVETLKKRLHNYDDQYQLDLINKNAAQILELVNQLIDLSKAEANVLRLNESLGDLRAFLNELVNSFESQAQAKSIQITFQAERVDPQYWFDTEKLERIITNLMINALKFTPVGGKVNVILALAPQQPDTFTHQHRNQVAWLQITISDNGTGIESENLSYIFNRFYQVEGARTEVPKSGQVAKLAHEGMGIRLSLVKELVEFQAGTIEVISKASLGTTFIIRLPYRTATSEPTPLPDIVPEPGTSSETSQGEKQSGQTSLLLLVEDNAILRDFIVENLAHLYTVHQAKNGAEGWEQAINLIPDLVISDIMMPVMDGYALCQKLKKDPRTSHIPVVLLTAKASVDERLEGLSLGADDYIAKPFHIQELQLRIRNLLEQRRQLQQWVLASITSTTSPANAPSTTDPLIEKLCQLVEEHLDETAFGAEELTLASGMSRMNLHRKLRALADTSTGEFIRNYRLKRATQFLREGRSVSETAYLVGFEDPSYFARSFRKVYKTSPSAFSRTNE